LLNENDKDNLPEIVRKSASSIYNQGKKLAALVDNLIDFVSIENLKNSDLKISESNIEELFMEIIGEYQNKDSNIIFKTAILDKFSLNVDRELIKKALKQLIDNGIKFNRSEQKLIILSAQIKDNKKMISVGDNGIGIPGEEISKIFNKFYQIEASFTGQVEGWGLGLALVKKIVSLHNGKVFVKSQIDRGSAFTIVL